MRIRSLQLTTFRNYLELNLDFSPEKNYLLIGENGQGKTNILEAINLLETTKSHRTRNIRDCIMKEKSKFVIRGEFSDTQQNKTFVAIQAERNGKKTIKTNNDLIQKSSDIIGCVNVVLFSPEDLQIIQGAPANRRKFLDLVVLQTQKAYYHLLVDYQKLLKHRNETLKNTKKEKNSAARQKQADLLDVWDEKLIEKNLKIAGERKLFIGTLNETMQKTYRELGFNNGRIEVVYKTNVLENPKEKFLQKRELDILTGSTSVGIHLDDFEVLLDKEPARLFCSQGQQRALSLALKLAEIEIKTIAKKEVPLVLIDDVLQELDKTRYNKILEKIIEKHQVICTTTTDQRISEQIKEKFENIFIKEGKAVSAALLQGVSM